MTLRRMLIVLCFLLSRTSLGNLPLHYCEDKYTLILSSGRVMEDTALQAQTMYFSTIKKLRAMVMDYDASISPFARKTMFESLVADLQDYNEFRCWCPKLLPSGRRTP